MSNHEDFRFAPATSFKQEQASQQPEPHPGLERMKSAAATEVASLLAGLSDSMAAPFGSAALNWTRGITMPSIPGTNKLSTPRPDDYELQMRWAKHARDVSIANGPLARRLDFVISTYRHKHSDPKVVKFFDKLAKKAKLEAALRLIGWEYMTVGWTMVLPDSVNPAPIFPDAIHIMQEGIKNEPAFGQDNFYIEIDRLLADNIRVNETNFPPYLRKAVGRSDFNGRVPLLLNQEDGDCYFVGGLRGINQPFPRSPMFPLFEPLKVIENLVETQYAISFAIKQLMLHVKVSGGKDATGADKSPSLRQLQGAARQVFDGARVATIVTPATTELQFVSPEKDIFEATDKPYQRAMERVERSIRIPMILVDGRAEGISFSTASVVIKAFLQSVRADRRVILREFVYPWYEQKARAFYEADPEKYGFLYDEEDDDFHIPQLIFDETELRNVTEMIALATFKLSTGAYAIESIMDMFQDDIDVEKPKKMAENEDNDWIFRVWEPNQGASETLLDHNAEEKDEDRQLQEKLAKENRKAQLEAQKNRQKSSPAGKKGPGKAGRPSSPDAAPRPDNETHNPRANGPSPSAQATSTAGGVLKALDDRFRVAFGLRPRP